MRPTCPTCKNPMRRDPEVRWRCRTCKPAKPDTLALGLTDKDMEYAKWLEWLTRYYHRRASEIVTREGFSFAKKDP